MNDVFEQIRKDLEKSIQDMPEDARDFGLVLANFYLLMEASKVAFKIMYEHKGEFEK